MLIKRYYWIILLTTGFIAVGSLSCQSSSQKRIGVLYVVHGGFDEYSRQNVWDSFVQIFAHDPNHFVYKNVIWNSSLWPEVLQATMAHREMAKYEFAYEKIGGHDPFYDITMKQLSDLEAELNQSDIGWSFVVDHTGWIAGDQIEHFPYPRFIYRGEDGQVGQGDPITYCGEGDTLGPWEGCNPDRYNVDGPVDRLLSKNIEMLLLVDMTVGGVRFSKTYDVLQMVKRAMTDLGKDVEIGWVNDPTQLLQRSYPILPEEWTRALGPPEQDSLVPLDDSPNPIALDPELSLMHVEGIEAAMSEVVADSDTGIILINHALHQNNQFFDPKIDDTLIVNQQIVDLLVERHPDLDPAHIVGAFMGVKTENPDNGLVELSREMRGENLGHAYMYESDPPSLPAGKWGMRYWEALQFLMDQGAQHIVIAFPQIVTDSVLNLVEVPNQIAKEIGKKTWLNWGTGDFDTYPGTGNPFADYWGIWAKTECGEHACCFEMGGCDDGRPYPPARQGGTATSMPDDDPSLAYDVSDYGHLGYDPGLGDPPDPDNPVQDQYTGTWSMYRPPNADPRLSQLVAKHVLQFVKDRL